MNSCIEAPGRAIRWLVVHALRGYKWLISPLLPPSCRYVPSCSEFALEAVERFGIVRGGFKAVLRVLRCHPFAKGGYDPVVRNHAVHEEAIGEGEPFEVNPDIRVGV